ncbi:nuclear transport factor 2 family protein [Halomonas sp. ML-15]|uniref:nuclear transport factor 2 family protein n=1 Tax=Halomonas sp. ML-15 TaxID=2773305 RepID=UPI001746FAE9|nr:nuclear transport factor 2 family protein [Halomonas sp. ML-15]MBD3897989.1 nuclear transport factor 2 family protein [Halomonas sp. ML-15]
MHRDPSLEAFCDFYNKLDKTSTNMLPEVYTRDVVFQDPLHRIEGIEALVGYFAQLYANVETCHFEFGTRLRQEDTAFVTWTMTLRHPRLAGGRDYHVEGCSRLRFAASDGPHGERVCQHRDYFDAGDLLYERLPLLGSVIRQVKRRVG